MFRATPGDILPGQTLLQIATPRRWSEAEGPMPPAGRGSAQRGRLGGELFADRLSRTRCSCCRCLSAGEGVGQPCGIGGRLATGYKSLCPGGQLQMSRSAASLNRAGWGPAAGLPIPSVTGPVTTNQKAKLICRSMLRLAAGEEKKPPDRALDLSNNGDSSTPTGCARFTLLKTFLAMAAKVSE